MRKYKRRRYRKPPRIPKPIWSRNNFNLNNKVIWVLFFSLMLTAGFVYLGKVIYDSSIFRIKEIRSNLDVDKDLKRSIIGKSLFTLDIHAIYSRLRRMCPECKNIYLSKEFPSFLKIEVKKREPFVQIKAEKFYFVDNEGVIISEGQSQVSPGLISVEINNYNAPLKKNEQIRDERLGYVFNLIEILRKEKFFDDFSIKVINATYPQAMHLVVDGDLKGGRQFNDGVKVIIGKDGFEHKLYLFYNVVKEKLKGDLSLVDYVDLRYNKVYLGYKR